MLVVNRVDLWAYYLWGTLRLLLPDPFFFALGWFYGPAALRWMEKRTPTVGTMMRRLEGWFGKWGHPLVVLMPNNYVCLIAGASGMSPVLFAFLNVTGTVGRLVLLQIVGDVFSGPIDWFLDLVATYRIPLLVISVVIVAVMAGGELRRGRKEIEGLQELEHSADPDAPRCPTAPTTRTTTARPGRFGGSDRPGGSIGEAPAVERARRDPRPEGRSIPRVSRGRSAPALDRREHSCVASPHSP